MNNNNNLFNYLIILVISIIVELNFSNKMEMDVLVLVLVMDVESNLYPSHLLLNEFDLLLTFLYYSNFFVLYIKNKKNNIVFDISIIL